MRRIEAITGEGALAFPGGSQQQAKCADVEQVEKLDAHEQERWSSEIEQLKNEAGAGAGRRIWKSQARDMKGVKVLVSQVDGLDRAQLRDAGRFAAQQVEDRRGGACDVEDSNVSIISAVTKDLTAKVHAGKLVGRGRAGRRRQGRRPARHGGGRRSRIRSALPAALDDVYTSRRGNAVTDVRCRRWSAPGPPASPAASNCKRRGVRAVLIDKGCVVNSLYHYPTNMVFFTTPELLEIGDIPMTSLER